MINHDEHAPRARSTTLTQRIDQLNVRAANLRHAHRERAWRLNRAAEHLAQTGTLRDHPYYQGLVDAWYWRGKFHALANDHEAALACFFQALSCCTHLPPVSAPPMTVPYIDAPDHFVAQSVTTSAVHNMLGVTLAHLAHFNEALQHYLAAQQLAAAHQDEWLLTLLCNNIGYIYREWHAPQQTLRYVWQGLQRLAAFPATRARQRLEATLLDNCCWGFGQLGVYAAALACGQRSRQLYHQLGWEPGLAEIHNCLGTVYTQMGDATRARTAFARAYQLAQHCQLDIEIIEALIHLSRVHWQHRASTLAMTCIHAALRRATALQQRVQQAQCHQLLAAIYEATNQLAQALAHYKQFAALHQAVFTAQAHQRLRVYQLTQQLAQARTDADLHRLRAAMLEHAIQEHAQRQAELEQLAATDPLTGIANRRAFFTRATIALRHAHAAQQSFSLLLFDIDWFKAINDTYGHAVGDQILCVVAAQAQTCIRSGDLLARYGGEEFVLALPTSDHVEALRVAERLRVGVAAHVHYIDTHAIQVTVSIGVTVCAARDTTLDQLLQDADQALYTAKQAGRNRVHCAL